MEIGIDSENFICKPLSVRQISDRVGMVLEGNYVER